MKSKALSSAAALFAAFASVSGAAAKGTPFAAAQTARQTRASTRVEPTDRFIAEGVAALEQGDVPAAQGAFQKALQANPDDVTAHTYLGVIADRAGDLAGAEKHFAAAAIADPLSPSVRNNHGAVLLKLGRVREAAKQFEASLRLNKDQPSALVNLAQIRFAASASPADMRAARDLFARAYALAPDVEIARALVAISLRLGERDAAAKFYQDYAGYLAGASGQMFSAAARAELGGALLEAGLNKEASAELSAAVAADPSNADGVLRLAKAQIALGEIPSAGRTLESALARGVETAPIYALLASVYEKSGHVENAIPAMRLAIERDPQSETYRFTYGMLLTSVMAPRAAVIRLKEAIGQFPRSARLWLALGIAQFKESSNGEAAESLLRAIELDPKFAPAYAYLGMTYVEVGRHEDGLKAYERALTVNKNLGVVDFLIADALQRQASEDTARMETHLRRAVQLEPSFTSARLALGKLYLRTERLQDASAELEQVVKLDPNIAEAYYQLGRVYVKLKRTAEAQATLATFKRLSDTQKEQEQKDRKDIVRRLADVRF